MEIRINKHIVVTGRKLCFVAAIISLICSIYWITLALVYDETHLPSLLSSVCCSMILMRFSRKSKEASHSDN